MVAVLVYLLNFCTVFHDKAVCKTVENATYKLYLERAVVKSSNNNNYYYSSNKMYIQRVRKTLQNI